MHNPYKATVQAMRIFGDHTDDVERRSSPLFVHLQKLPSNDVAVVVMFVPAPLLPRTPGSQITIDPEYDDRLGGRTNEPAQAKAAVPDYSAVRQFLETLKPKRP